MVDNLISHVSLSHLSKAGWKKFGKNFTYNVKTLIVLSWVPPLKIKMWMPEREVSVLMQFVSISSLFPHRAESSENRDLSLWIIM